MPNLDSTAKAALTSHFAVAWFIFLDVSGDPIRITTFGSDITFASTGDTDLDGFTFNSFGGRLIDVGDVSDQEGGSDTLTITLSGIVSMDTALVNEIGNKALWQGRLCRIWFRIYDPSGATPQGAIVSHYTGYMSSVDLTSDPETQTIQLAAEKYLSFYSSASNRSYLSQKDYDSADTSAAATIVAANSLRASTGGAQSGGGGSAQMANPAEDRRNVREL